MRFITDWIDDVDYVINNLDSETDKIIDARKQDIIVLNTENQLFGLGIGSDGKKLFPSYANITIFDKRQRGLPFNRVTLFQTGKFYDGFDIIKKSENITLFSRDSKSSDLQDKYGSSIFGLTTDNQEVLNYKIILPQLQVFINKYI